MSDLPFDKTMEGFIRDAAMVIDPAAFEDSRYAIRLYESRRRVAKEKATDIWGMATKALYGDGQGFEAAI